MIAYWQRLQPVFTEDTDFDSNPCIEISNIHDAAMREILYLLMNTAADVDTSLHYAHRYAEVFVGSVEEVVHQLMAGEMAGVLWLSLDVDGYVLPRLGFFIDQPGHITIDYEMGKHWTPIALMVLFELFRQILAIDEQIEISLSAYYFWKKLRLIFDSTLLDYLNETT